MENKDELQKSILKNRTYCYFHDINKGTDINFSNILLDKKSYENI